MIRLSATQLSQGDTSRDREIGACSVCDNDQIGVIRSTGRLRKHGPRSAPCGGYNSLPVEGSVRIRDTSASSTSQYNDRGNVITEISDDGPTAPTGSSLDDTLTEDSESPSGVNSFTHPMKSSRPILKRIPKGVRGAAASLLSVLITAVLENRTSLIAWSRLLGFAQCFSNPPRGGRSRNLTTLLLRQIESYATESNRAVTRPTSTEGESKPPTRLLRSRDTAKTNPSEKPEAIAKRASLKLEDGDVRGAIRILSSSETIAPRDAATFEILKTLHPPRPPDRRPAPTTSTAPIQVTPISVRKAIMSFPNGSAGGPDGLRPRHLKDLLIGAEDDHPLLQRITELMNLILDGSTPTAVRPILFGASLTAITKQAGGIRPIAVGYLWRRLSGKLVCNHVSARMAALLSPHQLGFGVKGGAEAGVRAARRFITNLPDNEVMIKIDFRNAFNTLRRDVIMEAVKENIPEVLNYALSAYDNDSRLQFGEFNISSEEGAQQGDPLGPLYFCLAIHKILENMQSKLVMAYLDDMVLAGEASVVAEDFLRLEAEGNRIGLSLNRHKCEVIGHSTYTRSIFTDNGIILQDTDINNATLLGAPLTDGVALEETLVKKVHELKTMSGRLDLLPAHDALYMLQHVVSTPKLMYLLRTSPCMDRRELVDYDLQLRSTLSSVLNIDLSEDRWQQASLPVRWGGLGVRGAVMLAPSAYLASAASTTQLVSRLTEKCALLSEDPYVAKALASWSAGVRPTATPPLDSSAVRQRSWDDTRCDYIADMVSQQANSPAEKARLLAIRAPGAGSWLKAMPLTAVGLKLDDATLRVAVGLRLGAPLVHPHNCSCGEAVLPDGRHGLSCRKSAGRQSRHGQLNDILLRAFNSIGITSMREPTGLCRGSENRPDGVTVVPWRRGKNLAWDATCADTFAVSHLPGTSVTAGAAARTAEANKRLKYQNLIDTVEFVPVAAETLGSWGPEGYELITELGRRISVVKKEPLSGAYLLQRLSIAIQRGNAYCVLATCPQQPLPGRFTTLPTRLDSIANADYNFKR